MCSEKVIETQGRWLVSAKAPPAPHAPWYEQLKRLAALFFAVTLLVLLLPLLLVIAIGVRLSGRQIFFAHERIGLNGKPFKCLKFRTMRVDAEQALAKLLAEDEAARAEWERDFKLKNDPRITRFGAFLRKTSLDELPQLFNVVRGEMSLVGPRPVVAEELSRYGRYARYYLATRPGMTGLWQVSGRNNTSYRRRVAMDCTYVRRRSLALDIRILIKTAVVVIGSRGNGAY